MESNENVIIPSQIVQIIRDKYKNHCIYDRGQDIIQFVPLKIARISGLHQQLGNLEQVQYLFIQISSGFESVNARGWDRYQEFFDLCPNLKAVALGVFTNHKFQSFTKEEFMECRLPNMFSSHREIWKERVSHIESRGIKICTHNEIFSYENITKLIKEFRVNWNFLFGIFRYSND